MKLVLKAQSQSSVLDRNDSIDLNPGDAVNLKVGRKKASLQELAARIEPVWARTRKQAVSDVFMEFGNAFHCVPLPWVAGAALLQTNIPDTFQLGHKKLDGVIHRV